MGVRIICLLLISAQCGLSIPAEDPCIEAVDPGPCTYFQTQWYWDAKVEQCKKFHYGGCLGTKNRFASKSDCLKLCVYKLHNPASIPEICLMPKDQGHCGTDTDGLWWWHFNGEEGHCEKFYYYGCGGNANRFYSKHYCNRICGERLGPQIACERCDARSSRCVSSGKYNYTCECLPGFEKNQHAMCTDVDECRTYQATCDRNAWCINTIGSYRCECMAGFKERQKKCLYVGMGTPTLDCNKCDSQSTCQSGVCQCKIGFKGDGMICTDVNECLQSPYPCSAHATCENTPGSFICKCRDGFAGNGYVCTDSARACLDKWHRGYEQECAEGVWHERYFYDQDTKRCSLFWYSACNATSRNMFPSLQTCETMCERSHVLERAKVCWDSFDPYSAEQCGEGQWTQRFYFDPGSLTCRMFWHDGCTGVSRNVFTDLLTCQWLCEVQPMYKSKSCLEEFDEHYKDQCEGGRWRQFYYYDRSARVCHAFWFDGCRSQSQNIFTNYETCSSVCEDHQFLDPNTPSRIATGGQVAARPKPEVTCEPNPCMNMGVCKPTGNRTLDYTCECRNGFTDARCTTPPEHPCLSDPCRNGGLCIELMEPRKMYKCQCLSGYFGPFCDPNPCLSNPCVNNGTCRTMKGFSTFFCECAARFSGSRCQFDRFLNEITQWGDMSDHERDKLREMAEGGRTQTQATPNMSLGFGGSGGSLWGMNPAAGSALPALPAPEAQKHTGRHPDAEYDKHVIKISSGRQEWVDELNRREQLKNNQGRSIIDEHIQETEPNLSTRRAVQQGSDAKSLVKQLQQEEEELLIESVVNEVAKLQQQQKQHQASVANQNRIPYVFVISCFLSLTLTGFIL